MQTLSITFLILYCILYVKFANFAKNKIKNILLYNDCFINKMIILDKSLKRPGDTSGTVGSVILNMGQTDGFRLFQNVPS